MGDTAASGPQSSADGPEFKTYSTPLPKKVHKPKNIIHDIKVIVNPVKIYILLLKDN